MTVCETIFPYFSSESWRAVCLDEGWASSLASLLAVLVVFALVFWMLRAVAAVIRQTRRLNPGRAALVPLIAVFAALLLALAAGRPAFVHARSESADHIILLVDQSESARRRMPERTDRLRLVANYLAAEGRRLDDRLRVSVVDFAAGTSLRLNRGAVSAALDQLSKDRPGEDLAAGGSDLGAALDEARRLAGQEPDGDLVVLISDGNDTVDGLDALARSAVGGPSVFAWPVNAGAPAEGIVSSYLPAMIESGSEPTLRLVFDPGAQNATEGWRLRLRRNGTQVPLAQEAVEAGGGRKDLQVPVGFDGRGLQFVETEIIAGSQSFEQRLFTLVKSPIRVAGVGDTGFLSSLPQDGFAVTRLAAADLTTLADYDVVVLGGLDAAELPAPLIERLAKGVSTGGLGLLLVNGPMRGTVEDPTVIQSYAETPLDRLLPVSPDPKFLLKDPPPRDIIVLVDTSPSMGGTQASPGGLQAAAKAIDDILVYMRPVDKIQIVTFGGLSSGQINGDEAGKARAREFSWNFPSGDSSNVTTAFERARGKAGNYTSVFLITDGRVDPYNYAQAGLSFYYLEYGSGRISNPVIAAAAKGAQTLTQSGLSFTPDSFEPEEKTEFFAPGRVLPKTVKTIEGIAPDIPTDGVALSYPRSDADVALVSDSADGEPVLAFREAKGFGGGQTAAFLSAFGGAWTSMPAGAQSLEAIITRLTKWSDRARYDIRVTDRGTDVTLRITVLATKDSATLPDSIEATLVGETTNTGVALLPVEGTDGVFEGRIRLLNRAADDEEPFTGLLVIEEKGVGAASGSQSIPFRLPDARRSSGADMREAASFGIDRAGLERLTAATAGAFDALPGQNRGDRMTDPAPVPAQLPFIGLAALLFALALLGKAVRL